MSAKGIPPNPLTFLSANGQHPSFGFCMASLVNIVLLFFDRLLYYATQVGDRVATVKATDLDSGEFKHEAVAKSHEFLVEIIF